ncbi:cholesterol 7-alpha-monooxygenase [Denticeps clupeoides]|uniref:Uncharacterized protein n=1 Tax=Denticeps clupeoides TaxID=299321 RepID=A0AAY4E3Z3_9TELE|nr:cholesterol 7-alpha-monooxygenase-like [Denticeps clupeoides]
MSALLLAVLAVLLPPLLLWACWGARTRRAGEPPLEGGWIPFFGVALSYGRDPLAFLRRTRSKCGDVFTCRLAGGYITFITDPFSFPAVVRQGRNLDFQKFAQSISCRVFGHVNFNAPMYTSGFQEVHSLYREMLQGPSLTLITQSMLGHLQTVLWRSLPKGGAWEEDGLQSFTNRIMFEAGFLTVFGQERGLQAGGAGPKAGPCMRQVMRNFMVFDSAFPEMVAGLPIHLCVRAWLARKALVETFYHAYLQQHYCVSALIQKRMDAFDRMRVDESSKAQTNLCMLWASQANTLPATFWSLYHMLRSPEAFQAARAEVDRVLSKSGHQSSGTETMISISKDQLDSMFVLGSIVEEALRLSSASIMIRVANNDFELTLDSGQTAAIRQGDYIALYPQFIHMDPDIYPNPTEFQFDRFLDESGQRKSDFYKAGRRLKHYLLPFGSGASACPGRFFAMNEIKQFLALMLWHCDLELPHSGAPLETDCSRAGLGILPPTHDVLLRYRLRDRGANSGGRREGQKEGEGETDGEKKGEEAGGLEKGKALVKTD